jgi:hypothetical protein
MMDSILDSSNPEENRQPDKQTAENNNNSKVDHKQRRLKHKADKKFAAVLAKRCRTLLRFHRSLVAILTIRRFNPTQPRPGMFHTKQEHFERYCYYFASKAQLYHILKVLHRYTLFYATLCNWYSKIHAIDIAKSNSKTRYIIIIALRKGDTNHFMQKQNKTKQNHFCLITGAYKNISRVERQYSHLL